MFSRLFLIRFYLPLLLSWTAAMTLWDKWALFAFAWPMAVTMAFGSFIAGSTSLGGGAVAFPVMTLILEIPPAVARDFALMIQAVGMMSASIAILLLRIPHDRRAVFYGLLGSLPGLLLGLELISPLLRDAAIKTLFGSFIFSFGLMLWWINRHGDRLAATGLPTLRSPDWMLLVTAGFLGGVVSGILGSGVDIVVFAVLVLRFGLCEKTATPTSVILMGVTSLAALLWGSATGGLHPDAWSYWWAAAPVVAFGAPFGAWCMSRWSRAAVIRFLCILIVAQYAGVLLVVPQTPLLLLLNAGVIGGGLLAFRMLHRPSPL